MHSAAPTDRSLEGRDSQPDWTERLPLMLLAVAMAISTWLVLSLNSGLTFFNDEWDPLLNRTGWGLNQIFAPFNGHPTMIPMVVYKTVQELFGMDSARPIQIIHAGLLLVMNGVLFVYLRRRVGSWAALIGTVMILFLGAAFEVLLFSFTINFTGALAAGIGALLALDRNDRKGDIAASALLVVGVFFSMVIVPFIIAATAEWLLNPRNRRGRWFVPGAPILFLAFWWLVWGRGAGASSMSLSNVFTTPGTVFEALGSGFTSLLGLATGDGSEPDQPYLIWGKLLAIGALALAWWRTRRIGRPLPRDFLVVGAAFLTYLILLGLGEDESRQPTFSRFQLPTAIFILMTASTLLEGIRLRISWLAAAAIVAALSIQGGVRLMEREANGQWTVASQYFRTYLTGMGLAGPDATRAQTAGIGPWVTIAPARYNEISAEYGSPALEVSELAGLESRELYWLDTGLITGTGVGLDAEPPDPPASTCRGSNAGAPIEARPGRYRVENASDGEVTVLVARLGPPPGTAIGATLPNSAAGLNLPAGDVVESWQVSFEPDSPSVAICGP